MRDSDQLLTTREVSKILGVTEGTIRAWAAAGSLPSMKFCENGRLRFPLSALRECIAQKTAKPVHG